MSKIPYVSEKIIKKAQDKFLKELNKDKEAIEIYLWELKREQEIKEVDEPDITFTAEEEITEELFEEEEDDAIEDEIEEEPSPYEDTFEPYEEEIQEDYDSDQ